MGGKDQKEKIKELEEKILVITNDRDDLAGKLKDALEENEKLKGQIEILEKARDDAMGEIENLEKEMQGLMETGAAEETEKQKIISLVALVRFNNHDKGDRFDAKEADADKWKKSGLAVAEEDYEKPEENTEAGEKE